MDFENVIDIEVESVDEIEAENVADLEVEVVESGPQGDPGIQGPPGLSAYEIYLQHGGTLSETEWLESLKGETGDTGADGKDGVNGKDGEDGYTPVKGKDYFTEEDIAEILSKIPEEYITEEELNEKGFLTEIPDGYATEEYVDDAIANIDIPESSGNSLNTIIDVNAPLISKDLYNQTGQIKLGDVNTDIEFIEQLRSAVQLMKDNILAGKTGSVILKVNFKPETFTSWTASNYVRSLLFTLEDSGNAIMNETTNPNRMYFINVDFTEGKLIRREIFFSTTWDENNKVTISSNPQMTYSESSLTPTDYLSKTNTTEYTPTSDYHPSTKKYVDDAIANIDVSGGETEIESPMPIFEWVTGDTGYSTYVQGYEQSRYVIKPDEEGVNNLKAIMQNAYDNNIQNFGILMNNSGFNKGRVLLYCKEGGNPNNLDGGSVSFTGMYIESMIYMTVSIVNIAIVYGDGSSQPPTQIIGNRYVVRFDSDKQFQNALKTYGLPKNNTTEFTPTADYHPSTKKYVDDAIAAAITSVLEAEY